MGSLGNNIPANIPKIEHQVLGLIVDRPLEDLRPVFEICPRLVRCSPRKGRESGEELEENATKRPIIDGGRVWLPAQNLGSHVVRRANNRIGLQGGRYEVSEGAMKAASVYKEKGMEGNEVCTHKSWVGLPHGSKYTSPLESTPMDDLVVFYSVELDTQGLNALGVQLPSGETKVCKLDMPLAIHKEVLGHKVERGVFYFIMAKRTSGLRSR